MVYDTVGNECLLIYILFILSAISKAVCDKIQYQPSLFIFQSDWWLAKGKYAWDKRKWIEKYIFSFINDGWHLFDAIRVMSLCIVIVLCTNIPIYWAIGLYVIHGIIFELTYKIKG